MKVKDVLSKELELISVPKSEVARLKKISGDFVKVMKEEGLNAQVGGSLAKGTLVVKERQDVDIFVVFDYSEDISKLGKVLKKIKLPGKLKRVHGSRDYFQVVCDEVVLEVIPVVKNNDPELAENVTDVSLRHVKYVTSKIRENLKIADEIKLAKAFVRAQRCYGAEGYIRGFSGYSLEVLVIYFGGFLKFIKGVRRNRVVDPEKYFKGEAEIMREINSSKLQGPLIVVDPTFKHRNVCAGLGLSSFEKFLEVSEEFLKKSSLEFFERKDVDVEGLEKFANSKKARFLELELSTDRQEGDIAGTKMRKFFRFFEKELVRKGQEVLRAEFDYSGEGKKAKGYLVVLEKSEIERRGPSVGLEEQAVVFCKANKGCFKRKGFWWCREEVSVDSVLEFVRKFEGEMGVEIKLKKNNSLIDTN